MKNRHGSYKKLLLSEEALLAAGPWLYENLSGFKMQDLTEQDFATLYILLYLRLRTPKNWLQPKQNNEADLRPGEKLLTDIIPSSMKLTAWEMEKLQGLTGRGLFDCFVMKGIPLSVNRAMVNWYEGKWKIKMLEYIPSSRELLKLQVQNTRCITLMTSPENCAKIVLGSRDPLSFVLHDLMHADQFFSHDVSQKGQLGFYSLINAIYDKTETRSLLKTNPDFKKEFEYIASDMNAYVIHLFKCLKSSIYRTEEKESYFGQLLYWWNMSEEERNSSMKLNTPDFDTNDEMVLKNFFERHQEIFT